MARRQADLKKIGAQGFADLKKIESNLKKIGADGFGIIEKNFGRPRRLPLCQEPQLHIDCQYQYQPPVDEAVFVCDRHNKPNVWRCGDYYK